MIYIQSILSCFLNTGLYRSARFSGLPKTVALFFLYVVSVLIEISSFDKDKLACLGVGACRQYGIAGKCSVVEEVFLVTSPSTFSEVAGMTGLGRHFSLQV